MSNSYANNEVVNNATSPTSSLLLDDISFNNYWIQNGEIITEWDWFSFRDYWNRRINLIDKPQADWQILNDVFFWWKTINCSGALSADNKSDLDKLIKEFKLALAPANKKLRWRVDWVIRTVNATVSSLTFGTKDNIYIPFSLTFVSQDAFWQEENQQSILLESQTNNTIIEQIENTGLPTKWFTVIGFASASSVTQIQMTSNWIWITINTAVAVGDIFYIDWINSVVSKNWVELDYDWVFPKYDSWTNDIVINIDWTYNADISIVYPVKIP